MKSKFALWILVSFASSTLAVHAASPVRAAKRAAEERYNEVTRKLGLSDQGQNSILFGGPTSGTKSFEGTLGFSNLPRLAIHYGLTDQFSVGGAFTFNLGLYNFGSIPPNIQFSLPVLFTFSREDIVGGIRIEPGLDLAFAFGQVIPGILFDLDSNIGFRVGDITKIGGGLNIPFALLIASSGSYTVAVAAIPLLLGPAIELSPLPELGIHFSAKAGPSFTSAGNVAFGMRLGTGVTYSF